MKKQIAVAVGLLVAAMAAGPCFAQRTTPRANIPFAFQVGNKTMPAGEYVIEGMSDTNEVAQMIRRTDSSAAVALLTLAGDAENEWSKPELVFHKYGNIYFLSEIWTGQDQGRRLPVSKREQERARDATGSEVAVSLQSVSVRGSGVAREPFL